MAEAVHALTLLFHDVVPAGAWQTSGFQGAGADLYKIDTGEFRDHLTAMGRVFTGPLTTGPLPITLPTRSAPVLLTFDDGGVSAVEHIADILDEVSWKAHFFVTAGRIGTPGFLDANQIRELRRRGHVIGSHSDTHPTRMSHCSTAQLDEEWQRSVHKLADIIGEPIPTASVPGGFYSRNVAASAARADIKMLFNSEPVTRCHTIEGCLVAGRFSVQRGHRPQRTADLVTGNQRVMLREYLFWNGKKAAKMMFGRAWLSTRTLLLELKSRR